MFELTILGRIDLQGPDGTRIHSVLQQSRRLALLAFVAIEGDGGHVRRDTLLSTFWPDADTDSARNRLKQALFFLRRSLDPAVLPTESADHLRLDPALFRCDALAFLEACRDERWADALTLYRGDLLPGFNISGSVEFDSWLERRRVELRNSAAEAGLHLAREAAGRGEPADVVQAARRVFALEPYDETTFRQVVRLMADAGDGAGVAGTYAEFERRVRQDLGVEPAAETRDLVEALLACPREDAGAAPTVDSGGATRREGVAPIPSDSRVRVRRFPLGRRVRRSVSAAVTAVIGVSAIGWLSGAGPDAGDAPGAPARLVPIVVIGAFDASSDSAAAAAGRILPAVLRHQLAQARGIAVQPAALDPLASGLEGPPRVQWVVEGVIGRGEDELVVDVALSDAREARVIWSHSLRGSADDPASVYEITDEMAALIRREIGRQMRSRERAADGELRTAAELIALADEARRKARYLREKGLVEVAEAGFAEADSLLALAEAAAPSWIDPTVGRARIAAERAWLALLSTPSDTAAARILFERGLQIATGAVRRAPAHAGALETRGTIAHRLQDLTAVGQRRAAPLVALARSDLERAVALDRDRVVAWSLLSDLAFRDADFPAALWMASRAYDVDRYLENIEEILLRLFASAYEVNDDVGATNWCQEISKRLPGEAPAIHCTLALLAWSEVLTHADADSAWLLLHGPAQRFHASPLYPRLEMMVASVLAGASLPDSAAAVAERAAQRGRGDPELLHFEAHTRMRLGQRDSALSLLEAYVAEKPLARGHIAESRRFAALREPSESR